MKYKIFFIVLIGIVAIASIFNLNNKKVFAESNSNSNSDVQLIARAINRRSKRRKL